MLQLKAYEIVFQARDGVQHKALLQRTSTLFRHGREAKALDLAILGMARQLCEDSGAQLLSFQRLESLGVEVEDCAAASAKILDTGFGQLAEL